MASQIIAEVTYKQLPGITNLEFVEGNALTFIINWDRAITTYDFYAAIYNNKKEVVVEFAVTVNTRSPLGRTTFSLTKEQTTGLLDIPGPLTWAMDWSPLGTWVDERTILAGDVTEKKKGQK